MSRPLRIEYLGAWYHIMNRGGRYEAIFEDKNDYSVFLELLQETYVRNLELKKIVQLEV